MTNSTSPLDIITRLHVMAHCCDIGVATPDRKHVARACRDAADEIGRMRKRIEGLEQRLDGLRQMNIGKSEECYDHR